MKKCNNCGAVSEDRVNFCTACGSSEFTAVPENNEQPIYDQPSYDQQPAAQTQYTPMYNAAYQAATLSQEEPEDNGNGNVIAGIVGAFLFALIGGLLYFIVYQLGIIAGICGLVIFVLANFGYGLFAKTKNKSSAVALVVSIIITVIMIFLAEYICLSYEIFQVYEDYNITIFDAIRATSDFITEPEIAKAVGGDLAFAYVFGLAAVIGNIVNMKKAKKKNAAQANAVNVQNSTLN